MKRVKEFFYGFAVLPHIKTLEKLKFEEDIKFITLAMGDLIGIPTTPFYKLALLPYFFPMINKWKEHVLSEKGALEKIQE